MSWHVQVLVLSRLFAQSFGLGMSMSHLGLKDFGRDSSSVILVIYMWCVKLSRTCLIVLRGFCFLIWKKINI